MPIEIKEYVGFKPVEPKKENPNKIKKVDKKKDVKNDTKKK